MNRVLLSCLLISATSLPAIGQEKMMALIIDGQNNHGAWPKTTIMMKQYLEETGLFTVDIERSAYTWKGENFLKEFPLNDGKTYTAEKQPKADPNFKPEFSKYDVVVNNFGFNAAPWPAETQAAFQGYAINGGAVVIIHAANNSFGDWSDYNKIIGIGGWGGRSEKTGPYVYFNDAGKIVRDAAPGRGGSHGPQHEYEIQVRNTEHPITKGMPLKWMHAQDELYDRLRGPAENMEVLATAYSSEDKKGTGRHEPMIMTIRYGKGRVFHTPMGHADYSMECVGFITTFKRGTEWAATGKVTQPIPEDFPGDTVSKQTFTQKTRPEPPALAKNAEQIPLKAGAFDPATPAPQSAPAPPAINLAPATVESIPVYQPTISVRTYQPCCCCPCCRAKRQHCQFRCR